MCLIRSPAISNANTVTMTPSCRATRPGWPLTVRSRIVMAGARLATLMQPRAICPAPWTGWRAALTRPPPSATAVAPGSSRPMRAPMSLASQARLKSLTMPACRAAAAAGTCEARTRRRADPPARPGQRLGEPFAHVALAAGAGRAEQVQADAAGDLRQPGAGGFDGVLLLPGQGIPAGVGLLDGVLGVGQRAQQPVGQVDQQPPLAHDRARARTGRAAS